MKRLILLMLVLSMIVSLSGITFASNESIDAVTCYNWEFSSDPPGHCTSTMCHQSQQPPFITYYWYEDYIEYKRQCENPQLGTSWYEYKTELQSYSCSCT